MTDEMRQKLREAIRSGKALDRAVSEWIDNAANASKNSTETAYSQEAKKPVNREQERKYER